MTTETPAGKVNSLARAGFVLALIAAALDVLMIPVVWFLPVAVFLPIGLGIPGLVMGHRGLTRIKQTGERGRSLAIAAIVMGYVVVGAVALLIVLAILSFLLALPQIVEMQGMN